MTQADFTIANQTFPNTRTELNTSLQALATNSAGNSSPATTFPSQWWFDSDDNKLYMRNKDNDAWVEILTIGATSDKVETLSATTIGASGTAISIGGIPFFSDTTNGSIYTHDVSGTDDTAQHNTAYGIAALDAITTGDHNTAIGSEAGSANTTGYSNTFIGREAGKANTEGFNNTFVGRGAGQSNTDADSNTFIGDLAGGAVTTGGANIMIGHLAGDNFDTETANLGIGKSALSGAIAGGEYNVAIGNGTLDVLTSGDYNVAVGYAAGTTMTSTTGNTLIGYEAGRAQNYDGASYVTMVGYQAGEDQTTSSYNTGFGAFNQRSSDTEQHNTSIGYYTMQGANGGGEYNTALGSYVLSNASQSGDNNVGVGYRALYVSTSGSGNTAIGYQAGTGLTTGADNILIGRVAGGSGAITGNFGTYVGTGIGGNNAMTSVHSNVFVGREAAYYGTTIHESVLVGHAAGKSLTTSGDVIFIGHNAGDGHDTENHNLGIGTDALGGSVAGGEYNVGVGNYTLDALTSGDDNIAVGYAAGGAITSGTDNTFIGNSAGFNTTQGSANIAIGSGCIPASTTGDFQYVLGFEIDASANQFAFGKSGNKVSNNFDTNASWTRSSDERKKTNIADATLGLDFINDLRTITFNWKASQDFPKTFKDYKADENMMDTSTTLHGMLAQDVKAALDTAGVSTFGGWTEESDGSQCLSQEMFVYPLIKAVQELSAQVTTLQQEIKTIKGE